MNRMKLSLFGGGLGQNSERGVQGQPTARVVADHLSGLTPVERAFADTVGMAKAPARA